MRVTLPGNNGGRFTMTGSLAFLQATITNGVDVDHDGTIADTDTVKEETNQAKISLNIKDPILKTPTTACPSKTSSGKTDRSATRQPARRGCRRRRTARLRKIQPPATKR